MCGILVYSTEYLQGDDLAYLKECIASRGPDNYSSVVQGDFTYESSLLSLRVPYTPQPLHDETFVFCYNGQIYDIPDTDECDTQYAARLCRQGQFEKLLTLNGEFAFVFADKDRIVFGRDTLGRRSLLYHINDQGQLVISSIAASSNAEQYIECDGGGVIYEYSFHSKTVERVQALNYEFSISLQTCFEDQKWHTIIGSALRKAVECRLVRPSDQPNIAVLFSGGLDCTILAALLDQLLPHGCEIHLLNVAFENKRTGSLWDTPDRLLARKSLEELRAVSKSGEKRFQLFEKNVPYEMAQQHIPVVKRLMAPTATVIDLSIALAFYFAARPESEGPQFPRILLSGLGADELFAGYSRHTSSATRGSEQLAEELVKDFTRLPHRNLGRDDRVCSTWGREVRYPFLDDGLVEVAKQVPLNLKTDGQETKIVLRAVARALGLQNVVHEKKRAIQFGARSAKMDPGSGRSKGHHSLAEASALT